MKLALLILILGSLSTGCGRHKTNKVQHHDVENKEARDMQAPESPLETAITTSDVFLLESYLKDGIDPNLKFRSGHLPLTLAAEKGDVTIIKLLVDNGAELDLKNSEGDTSLIAAIKNDNTAAAQFLINADAKTNAQDKIHNSVLINAILFGNETIARSLIIDENVDVFHHDSKGRSVLALARMKNMKSVANLIRAVEFTSTNTPDIQTVKEFVAKGDIDSLTIVMRDCDILSILDGHNILADVVAHPVPEIAEKMTDLMLSFGMLATGQPKDNLNPLILATQANSNEIVKTMMKFKPQLNSVDGMGLAALNYAVENNNYEIVYLLNSNGAKTSFTTPFYGKTLKVDACRTGKNVEARYRHDPEQKATFRSIRKILGCKISYIF